MSYSRLKILIHYQIERLALDSKRCESVSIQQYLYMKNFSILMGLIISQTLLASENPDKNNLVNDSFNDKRWVYQIHLDVYPDKKSNKQNEYNATLARFIRMLRTDFNKLKAGINNPALEDLSLLMKYIDIRDKLLVSHQYGNFILAGLITYIVDQLLAIHISNSIDNNLKLNGSLAEILRLNAVSRNKVFDVTNILFNDGRSLFDLPGAVILENQLISRDENWSKFTKYYGLEYVFKDGVTNLRPHNLEKEFIFLRELTNPQIIIRKNDPAVVVFYWANILDFRVKTRILWEYFENSQLPYDRKKYDEAMISLIGNSSSFGESWLMLDSSSQDSQSGLVAMPIIVLKENLITDFYLSERYLSK